MRKENLVKGGGGERKVAGISEEFKGKICPVVSGGGVKGRKKQGRPEAGRENYVVKAKKRGIPRNRLE